VKGEGRERAGKRRRKGREKAEKKMKSGTNRGTGTVMKGGDHRVHTSKFKGSDAQTQNSEVNVELLTGTLPSPSLPSPLPPSPFLSFPFLPSLSFPSLSSLPLSFPLPFSSFLTPHFALITFCPLPHPLASHFFPALLSLPPLPYQICM
jgi:hypothetical protein